MRCFRCGKDFDGAKGTTITLTIYGGRTSSPKMHCPECMASFYRWAYEGLQEEVTE